jgi:uncharacterized protein (DUF2141 family)
MHFYQLIILFIGFNTPLLAQSLTEHEITITFKNISTKTGKISFGLYKDADSFENEKPAEIYKIPKHNMVNGTLTYQLKLAPGTYAIAVLDDTNNNGEMDFNFIGYPLEGYGFSNYVHSGIFSPAYSDFDFTVNATRKVEVKMTYM